MTDIKPGLHFDMPNKDYHDDTEWMSSSRIKTYLPEHYKPGGSQAALDFGTLVHAVVLEPDNLGHYRVLDAHEVAGLNPKTGKPYDKPEMTAKFKAAVAAAAEVGETIVSADDWDRAHAMRDACKNHPIASRLLFDEPGEAEVSAFWEAPDGTRHKARFDRLVPHVVVDLKTTSAKPAEWSLRHAVREYGYHLSAAHYLTVADGLELDVDTFAFVFVTKDEPHYVTVCELDIDLLGEGHRLRDQALDRIANPTTTDAYPGATNILTL